MISEHASPLATLGGVDAGGQNVYVAQLAKHLAAAGDRVDVFTRRDAPDLPEVVEWLPGIRVVHVPAGPPEPLPKEQLLPHIGAFTTWMLRELTRRGRRYDVVHAHFFMSALVAAEIKQALEIPFVVTFHALGRVRRQFQGQDDGFPDERLTIEERVVAEADRILAECPQDEEDLIRLYNADPTRIEIVPCGFDPEEFAPKSRPLARLDLDLDPGERIVLQLGRIVPRKGVDNVIRAIGRLARDQALAVRLLVVGGPDRVPDFERVPELGRLRQIAREEGVEDRVVFVGRRDRDELATYYSAADVFVSTPWYEPFGITPLEAMACGTPVVGSNVGGIKFSVRDGETGYLVPPRDPDALAERIGHLYRHPKLLSVFARQAVRRVNDLFTWPRVAATVSELYDAVLAERRLARREVAEQLASVDRTFEESASTLLATKRRLRQPILEAAAMVTAAFARDGRLLVAGNGGSMAEAQHLAAEFVGRFRVAGRPGLAAIALGAEPASMTAWANDVGYEDVLAREVEAFGRRGDVLVGLSTSGRSPNLVHAFDRAREIGLGTVAIVGRDGGQLHGQADVSLVVPAFDTQRIQEVHGVIVHLLAELVEQRLADAGWFPPTAVPSAPDVPAATPVPIETSHERGGFRARGAARLAAGGRGGR
ncbi:MAG TPA: glycosyltransferase [Candidatus Limnocylindrales bacterium]|nr:glycosyltransferase [Candidatus Limnocylindrales bacterium]